MRYRSHEMGEIALVRMRLNNEHLVCCTCCHVLFLPLVMHHLSDTWADRKWRYHVDHSHYTVSVLWDRTPWSPDSSKIWSILHAVSFVFVCQRFSNKLLRDPKINPGMCWLHPPVHESSNLQQEAMGPLTNGSHNKRMSKGLIAVVKQTFEPHWLFIWDPWRLRWPNTTNTITAADVWIKPSLTNQLLDQKLFYTNVTAKTSLIIFAAASQMWRFEFPKPSVSNLTSVQVNVQKLCYLFFFYKFITLLS